MQHSTHFRQQNVQQQNAEVERRIRSEAVYWRNHDVPAALQEAGIANGVDWTRAIVVNLDIDFPGMPQLFGLLLTHDERFIRFALDTDKEHLVLESIDDWTDVTDEQNLSQYNPGIGMGFGALAIKVLHELLDGTGIP